MKNYEEKALATELLDFIDASPSSFHAVQTISSLLEKEGYTELKESEKWNPEEGKGYFVCRNGSSLIAFRYQKDYTGFSISAAHSDYPCFKIKDKGELTGEFVRLNTERYGGMICSTWLDRPLSVAGRVLVETDRGMEMRLLNIDRDLLLIPSVAIHMNRNANDGMKYNPAVDTVPLFGGKESKGRFLSLVAQELGVEEEKILGQDLYVYARQKGCIWGCNQEYISSRALDDLQCAFSTLKGFLAAKAGKSLPVCAVFDNEEVRNPAGGGLHIPLRCFEAHLSCGRGLFTSTCFLFPSFLRQRSCGASQSPGICRSGEPGGPERRRGSEIQCRSEIHHRRHLRSLCEIPL